METYNAKSIISGFKLGQQFRDKKLIAVPDKFHGKELLVKFGEEQMVIPKVGSASLTFRTFEDKFGREKNYTLIYYEWNPKG